MGTQSDASTSCRALPAFWIAASRNCKSASRTGGGQWAPPRMRISDDNVSCGTAATSSCVTSSCVTCVTSSCVTSSYVEAPWLQVVRTRNSEHVAIEQPGADADKGKKKARTANYTASNGCLFQRLYTLVIAFRHPTLTSRSSACTRQSHQILDHTAVRKFTSFRLQHLPLASRVPRAHQTHRKKSVVKLPEEAIGALP